MQSAPGRVKVAKAVVLDLDRCALLRVSWKLDERSFFVFFVFAEVSSFVAKGKGEALTAFALAKVFYSS